MLTKVKEFFSSLSLHKIVIGTLGAGLIVGVLAVATPANADTSINWSAIIQCESGGNPTAQNPHSSASGLYQITDGTWGRYGGYAHAKDAPPSVQTQKAMTLGISNWDASRSCWEGKTGGSVSYTHTSTPPRVRTHTSVSVAAPKVTSAPVGTGSYVVVSGDTLSKIGHAHGESWESIYAKNHGTVSNPNLIFVGQHLAL
jgi:LysM repeat protein